MNVRASAERTAGRRIPETPSAPMRWAPIPGFKPRAEDALAHVLGRVPALWLMLGAGIGSTAIYALFVLAFPITRWWNHPHLANDPTAVNDMGRITHYSPLAAVAFVVAIVALFAGQFLALMAIGRPGERRRPLLVRLAVTFPVVFAVLLIWMQPVTTTDLYGYVARGYLYAYQHLNPMTTPAFLLPGHLLVSRPAAPYGPVWLLITGAVAILSNQNLLINMLVFKLIAAVSLGAAVWLVYVLARRFYPERAGRVVLYFAWNPLVLFEAVGNGHNDIVMMACVLGALVLMVHRYARTAFALLLLGALIKYMAAVLIPLWLVYELGHRLRGHSESGAAATLEGALTGTQQRDPRLAARGRHILRQAAHNMSPLPRIGGPTSDGATIGDAGHALAGTARAALRTMRAVDRRAAVDLIVGSAAIGAVLVAGFYAPFWDGANTFAGLGQQVRPLYYNGSIVQFISAPLELLVPTDSYAALDKTVRLAFYAIFAIYAWVQTHRLWLAAPRATLPDLITAAAKIMFAALVLIAFWYQPWYVVWLLPLAALAQESFVRRQAAILSAGSLLTYAVGNFLFVHETGIGQALFVQFFEVLAAFAPLLLLRVAPADRSWPAIARRYLGLVGDVLRRRPYMWDRVMLGLVLVVAAMLRLLRLGNNNLFAAIRPDSAGASALRQLSGDLRLIVSDPRGLQGPFVLLQRAMVLIFGPTPFAFLLPSAVIGSLTVWVIYLLATGIFSDGSPARARAIGLLAALLAATSAWHVSLSRSGVEVLVLPLLMCLALYLLILALRSAPAAVQPIRPIVRRQRRHRGRPRHALAPAHRAPSPRRPMLLFAGCGIASGLVSDLAPGLWLLSLVVLGLLLVARWQEPLWYRKNQSGLTVLLACAVWTGLPGIWNYYVSPYFGFPAGSTALARSSASSASNPSLLSAPFWERVTRNAGGVLHVLTTQDYSAGWPSTGGTPILPSIFVPFFYIGIALVLWRWRRVSSATLLLLVGLPLLASVAVGAEPSVIQAASVLPATCIIPAFALYEVAQWLGRLPIALDRAHGTRVFATPERIGRVLLMVFLVVSALRTFYWYFQATLPATPPNSTIAS